jgi:hypothetical protein
MPTRGLTSGELQILDFVFYDTIDFERHEITTNDKNIGGADNSVTYSDTPHYSHQIWCADFSDPNADTWVFVHEFGHVWQYYYGVKPINGWIYGAIKYGRDYVDKMYPYDLTRYQRFKDYNIEQQASIVADYWAVSFSRPARHCLKPKSPTDSDYTYLMMQVQNAEKPPTL